MDTPIIARKKRMIFTVLRQWLDNKHAAHCLEIDVPIGSVFQKERKDLAIMMDQADQDYWDRMCSTTSRCM